jgi:Arc-like DNA binding domain
MSINHKALPRVKARKGDPQRTIRFPREIIEQLIKDANMNGRSINSEVVYRIAQGFEKALQKK